MSFYEKQEDSLCIHLKIFGLKQLLEIEKALYDKVCSDLCSQELLIIDDDEFNLQVL